MSENEKIEKTGSDAPASKPAKAEKKAKKDDKPGFFQRIARWFREMKSELKKVVWPSKEDTRKNTIVVLVVVIIAAAVLFILDAIFGGILGLVIGG